MKLTFRNVLTWFLAALLIAFGFVRRAKRRAMRGDFILSIYFHSPSRKEFESCVKWLKKNKFIFLSPEDIHDIIQKNLPLPKGAVLITVDDGWQTNEANIVEVANKHQVPVTIFVSTEPVEKGAYWWSYFHRAQDLHYELPAKSRLKKVTNEERLALVNEIKRDIKLPREAMTIDQISRISKSKYVTIGGHTHSHPILINCSYEQVCDELKLSKQKLESWTACEVFCFAFPNGDYSDREIQALSELDYKLAFSSDSEYLTEEKLENRFNLPRFGLLEGASLAENICRIMGVWKPVTLKFRWPYFVEDREASKPIFSSKRTNVVITN